MIFLLGDVAAEVGMMVVMFPFGPGLAALAEVMMALARGFM